MGIEPTALAWEARVLPLYDARRARYFTGVSALWGAGIAVGGVKSVSTSGIFAGFAVESMTAVQPQHPCRVVRAIESRRRCPAICRCTAKYPPRSFLMPYQN